MDMQQEVDEINGYRYLLTVIDVLSKYAWAVPLKNKARTNLADAIFEQGRVPERLQTDAFKLNKRMSQQTF